MSSDTRGPISWQQAARVRNEQRYGRYGNIPNTFTAPKSLDADALCRRMFDLARREESLWITDASTQDGGWVSYASDLQLPVQTIQCGSRAEMVVIRKEIEQRPFERDGGLLWRLLLLEHPDETGALVRTVSTIFDHLVSDGRSMHLVQKELMGEAYPPEDRYRGSYRQWVSLMRERYPHVDDEPSSPHRDFWLRVLDGVEADSASSVPFAILPSRPFRGMATYVSAMATTSHTQLNEAARQLKASPFLLVVASAVAAIARTGPVDDLIFRVISSGRPMAYMNTHGFFADSLPMRLRDAALYDPERVLRLIVPLWAQMMRYQDTPWDYIRTVCSPSGVPVSVEPGSQQLVVNFMPYESEFVEEPAVGPISFPAHIESLHLMVRPMSDGRCKVGCTFNADHFAADGVQKFVEATADRLVHFVDRANSRRGGMPDS